MENPFKNIESEKERVQLLKDTRASGLYRVRFPTCSEEKNRVMQREIKFRVFDKEAKTMYEVNLIDFEDKYVLYVHNNFYKQKSFGEIELMQFTGLHDKNGKEIYEGDLIKRTVSTLGKESTFVEKIIFSNGAFISEDKNGNVDEIYGLFLHTIEIIGNIYEPPELLK